MIGKKEERSEELSWFEAHLSEVIGLVSSGWVVWLGKKRTSKRGKWGTVHNKSCDTSPVRLKSSEVCTLYSILLYRIPMPFERAERKGAETETGAESTIDSPHTVSCQQETTKFKRQLRF